MRLASWHAAGIVALAAFALVSPPSSAGLPGDGWPQARRDAALSGRTPEPALPSARLRWIAYTNAPLAGEPVALGCQVAVTSQDGVISGFNARSGATQWTYWPGYAVPASGVA